MASAGIDPNASSDWQDRSAPQCVARLIQEIDMPTEQPSSAPDTIAPHDDDTAAGVLRDTADDVQPGGGGLGPRSANTGGTPHGSAPNAPIDTGLPGERPDAEARREATDPS
jgi:hypothetical protein